MISPEQCQNATILIVDNSITQTPHLEAILQTAGYTNVHVTTDAGAVVRLSVDLSPDLILLCIGTPHLDGLYLMKQLNGVPHHGYLPLLVLTSEEEKDLRVDALEAGAKDFLTHPLDHAEVLVRVRNLLEASLLHKMVHDQRKIFEKSALFRTWNCMKPSGK